MPEGDAPTKSGSGWIVVIPMIVMMVAVRPVVWRWCDVVILFHDDGALVS